MRTLQKKELETVSGAHGYYRHYRKKHYYGKYYYGKKYYYYGKGKQY